MQRRAKEFSIIYGYGVGEYIKNRRLSMAGKEVLNTDKKIMDIAMEYGYDSQDSFTKAFKRFHGFTPKLTWAIFPCTGKASESIRKINQKIFKEWLPNSNDYGIPAGYNIECYSNPKDYKKGIDDEKYYCEVWIPVKKK